MLAIPKCSVRRHQCHPREASAGALELAPFPGNGRWKHGKVGIGVGMGDEDAYVGIGMGEDGMR